MVGFAFELSTGLLFNASVDSATIIVALVLTYYVLLQSFPRFNDAKILLVASYFLFVGAVATELVSELGVSEDVKNILAAWQAAAIIVLVIVLNALAYIIYARPPEPKIPARVVALIKARLIPHGFAIFSSVAYSIFLLIYLFTTIPREVILTNLFGGYVSMPFYGRAFFVLVAPFAILIVGYSTPALFLAYRRASKGPGRRSMSTFLLSWLAVFVGLIFFDGFLTTRGIDARSFAFLAGAISFAVVYNSLRKVSFYEALFERVEISGSSIKQFREKIGMQTVDWTLPQLLEVDPSSDYENVVNAFAQDASSSGRVPFVFTSRGSPVWKKLFNIPNVRFYLETDSVSYPKLTDKEHEILIPVDRALLLDAIAKIIKLGSQEEKIAIVFDNISDLILNLGFETAYKFVHEACEILATQNAKSNVISMFVIMQAGQDQKFATLIKSLFSTHLVWDSSGLRATR